MRVDVLEQTRALIQAVLLGTLLGGVYDGMRILRCRLPGRMLESALDLLFWITTTVSLFVWSQQAWNGQIRLYGAVFCMLGGVLYFRLFSPFVLYLGYRMADLATLILGILTVPLRFLDEILKIFEKLIKNIFLSGAKWVKIERKPEEMERVVRQGTGGERSRRIHETQAGRISHQDRNSGSDDLHGHLPAGYAESAPGDPGTQGGSGKAGGQSADRKSTSGRRRRKQR